MVSVAVSVCRSPQHPTCGRVGPTWCPCAIKPPTLGVRCPAFDRGEAAQLEARWFRVGHMAKRRWASRLFTRIALEQSSTACWGQHRGRTCSLRELQTNEVGSSVDSWYRSLDHAAVVLGGERLLHPSAHYRFRREEGSMFQVHDGLNETAMNFVPASVVGWS